MVLKRSVFIFMTSFCYRTLALSFSPDIVSELVGSLTSLMYLSPVLSCLYAVFRNTVGNVRQN